MNRDRKIEVSKEILKFIGLAGAVGAMAIFLGVARIIGPFMREKRQLHVGIVNQALKRLEHRGFITIENQNGTKTVALTSSGILALQKMELGMVKIKKQKRWDEQWRIVIFDVLEKRRGARDQIRTTLKRLGFKRLQHSVWIYPYPSDEVVELVRNAYDLRRSVLYFTSPRFLGDYPLVRSFGLHHERE